MSDVVVPVGEEAAPPVVKNTDEILETLEEGGEESMECPMEKSVQCSVLRFKNVDFVVGKGENEKKILTNINGTVKCGRVLAVMGPSGAGKTTLINVLTLDALFGTPYGKVTLNCIPMTDALFKKHCFVVKQHDKHWPYLTARETLEYSAELYDVAERSAIPEKINELIAQMGLESCADTRCSRLSGGQSRRLSIAVSLLKRPTLLFLDEPTSGLDAAAASHIMEEIKRVAREFRLIIFCTIHQPSTKVYEGFDQLMILSKGQEAFTGDVQDAAPYFSKQGFPLPPSTNPAEHFLDLVNSDFMPDEEVNKLLDNWKESQPDVLSSKHGLKGFDECENAKGEMPHVTGMKLSQEMLIMFRRHFSLIVRDPILYLGRCLIFLVANLVFAFVYWNARQNSFDQLANKLWINIWFVAVPSNMGVVAVYALNDEFKSILRETKNGMVKPVSYVLAKAVLVLPIMFVFAFFGLGITGFAIQDFPGEAFGKAITLWAVVMYVFECAAESFSVWFVNPILGMLVFMMWWFASFLFAGFLIPLKDMYWPFELFYYVMPYAYYVRSIIYVLFMDSDWDDFETGEEALTALSANYPLISTEDKLAKDVGIMIVIAMFYKFLYVLGIVLKSRKHAPIHQPNNGA